MPDFLLELFSEEIPARMQRQAAGDLARLFGAALAEAGVTAETTETFVTPRRLALIARGLPLATAAVSEERRGPRADAPAQAVEGFLKSTGLARDQLEERDDPKGRFLYAILEKDGQPVADVLRQRLPTLIWNFPWPKSMRWGNASTRSDSVRWVRPLQSMICLLDETIVPVSLDMVHIYKDRQSDTHVPIESKTGIVAGRTTRGHRFLSSGPIEIASAATYAEQLRAAHVILSSEEREAVIKAGADAAAHAAGLTLIADAGLLAENAGLTEWPVPLLGEFDPAFLDVPPEVIQLTMRANQKYFACADAAGKLAPAFVCVANTKASDGGAAIVAGNRKVLAARLSDAKFFWEQDKKTTLESRLPKLADIVFHEKLGTVADKVERVAKLARWLVESGAIRPQSNPRHPREGGDPDLPTENLGSRLRGNDDEKEVAHLATLAETAARLCKADLVTAMVGEFPELQGVMGGYYARAEGLDPQVADAIRDHYKPVGQGDEVPTAPVTVAVSLADKLDSLIGFFAAYQAPTGSRDPFALRRSALGVLAMLLKSDIRINLADAFEVFYRAHATRPPHGGKGADAFHFALVDEVLTAKDFGSKAFWLERFDGIEDGQEVDQYVAHPLDFDDAGRWKLFELAFSNETVDFGKIGSDSVAAFTLADLTWAHGKLQEFFADRLKVQQREAGVRHDLIDAVFALGGEDDLVRLLARVKALQAFVSTEDGTNLLAGYKRAANILRIEEKKDGRAYDGEVSRDLLMLPEEIGLADTLEAVEGEARAAVEAEDFAAAMGALARLRPFVDAFFEKVTVNDPAPDRRSNRLALLNRIRAAVHGVADFSKIEG